MKTPNSRTAQSVLAALCTIGFSSIVAAAAATKDADRVVPGHAAIAPLSFYFHWSPSGEKVSHSFRNSP